MKHAHNFDAQQKGYEGARAFEARHEECSRLSISIDKTPGDQLTYTYTPQGEGGFLMVECLCGARWYRSNFGIKEEGPRCRKDPYYEEPDLAALCETIDMVREPEAFFPSAGDAVFHCMLAHIDALMALLEHLHVGEAYRELMRRVEVRVLERYAGGQRVPDIAGFLMSDGSSGQLAAQRWRYVFFDCLTEEYPHLASAVGVDV